MDLAALHLQLAPIIAAEKSKVPFYIVGGLLVVWAFTLSLGLGMRRPDFPGSLKGQRIVMGITTVLVAATLAAAVLTSSPPPQHALVTKNTRVELSGAPLPTQPAVGVTSTASSSTGSTTTSAASEKEPPSTVSEGGHKLT